MRQKSTEKEDMRVPYKLPHGWCWVKLGEASGKEGVAPIHPAPALRGGIHRSVLYEGANVIVPKKNN